MNISPNELDELNQLLSNPKLDLPDFRRKVGNNASNYQWLQRNILIRNSTIVTDRLKELLNTTKFFA
jgi:hypothetical protein